MNVLYSWRERRIAFCLVVFLLLPLGASATEIGQSPAADAATQAGGTEQSAPAAANAVPADKNAIAPDQQNANASGPKPASAQTGTPDQHASSSSTLADQTSPQTTESTPIGTAAAPYEKQEGVTATKPSGEAIAPGKQRRNHSFAIRVGLLVGAAAAIGIVTGASLGSPSRAN